MRLPFVGVLAASVLLAGPSLRAQPPIAGSQGESSVGTDVGSGDSSSNSAAVDPAREADWKAIQSAADRYVAAYNAADANAISKLFSEDAELVNSSGVVFRGRERIAEEFTAFFKVHPETKTSVVVDSLRFLGPSLAVEDGTTESRLDADGPPILSRYTAIHVKSDGKWLMASVRDEQSPQGGGANLESLSWMIGRWFDESADSRLEVDCYWHPSGSYLLREFKVKVKGLVASTGTERIGWDPIRRRPRSWLFDADGGYLDAKWIQHDGHWVVAASGFRADGQPIEATYLVTPLREDAYHLRSFNRVVGKEPIDDYEMTIVRRPPSPGDVPLPVAKPSADVEPAEKPE